MAVSDRGSSGTDQREVGRLQVVELIRASGQIARIDIARHTGMSPATVTAITQQLIQAGLVEEIAPEGVLEAARRGRPRVALTVRGDAHLVAGVKVSARSLSAVVVDFRGGIITTHTEPLPAPRMSPSELAAEVSHVLDVIMAGIGKRRSDLSGLGLGLSGFIDAPSGTVHWSASLSERNVRLVDSFADLGFPVFIDNDANLVAKAEQLFGEGRGVSDFLVVTIEQGVGMGIVIDGRIYRGARGTGAEFGHTKVHLDGALCRCGQRGCLEAYVSDYALLREADTLMPAGERGTSVERLDALFAAAHAGEPIARSILNRASRMFAMGLANLVNIFDPKLIILSGEQMSHDFLYADEVIAAMRTLVIQIDAPPPEVRVHKWGDQMWASGAAAFAMEGVTELAVRKLANDT